MNRRTFFQTAAVSTVAVLQSRGQMSSQRQQEMGGVPLEVDLSEPGAARYVEHGTTDLYVRLEELDPGDPGELSGAVLRISASGADVAVSAGFGEVLQRNGGRTSHFLGFSQAPDLDSLVAAVLDTPENDVREFCLLDGRQANGLSGARLVLFTGKDPELQLCIASHSLGVLSGDLLRVFFNCLRKRAAMGGVQAR
jgi:hypothetical protein